MRCGASGRKYCSSAAPGSPFPGGGGSPAKLEGRIGRQPQAATYFAGSGADTRSRDDDGPTSHCSCMRGVAESARARRRNRSCPRYQERDDSMSAKKELPADLQRFRDTYVELFGTLPPLPAARFELSGEVNPEFLRLSE